MLQERHDSFRMYEFLSFVQLHSFSLPCKPMSWYVQVLVDHIQLDDLSANASFNEVIVPLPMEIQRRLVDVSVIRTLVSMNCLY
jgi:hypothetical protein